MSRRPVAGRASISGVALVLALLSSLFVSVPAQAAGGVLDGTVTGPDGKAFTSFRIDVYEADGPDRWRLATSQTVWGSSAGEFAVSLPAGTYRACFGEPVEDWAADVGRRCWSGGYDVWGATDIVVAEGGTTTIDPSLPRGARVRGRIVGPGGVGITAYVAPYRRLPDGSWGWLGGAQSLADGSFVVPDLDPGTYRFCLLDVPREFVPECWDDAATVEEATDVTLRPGGAPIVSFWLPRRANVSGTITRPTGSTASIGVGAYRFADGRWEQSGYASVAPDGTYRVTGLQTGTYRVCTFGHDIVTACWRQGEDLAGATDIALATTQSRSGIDLAPGPAGFVSGTLPEVYLGAQGYPSVTAYRRVGATWQGVASGDSVPTGVGNDWTYEVGSLPTGTYVVCVEHLEPEFVTAFPRTCNGGSPSPDGAIPFEVAAGATTTGINIDTGQASEIRGRVLGAPDVRVDLYAPTGRLALSQRTGPDGLYRFRELPPGDYRVGFHRATARSPLAAEWWHNRGDGLGLEGATAVPVDGSVVTGISATLDSGGVISGRLLDAAGTPVEGCRLQARAPDGSLAVRTAVSDGAGDFAIGGLSTASYVVLVSQACSDAPSGLYYDTGSPDGTTSRLRDADSVAVTRGLTTTLAVELRTGG